MTEDIITTADMNEVYEVTDELGIDRESLRVELTKEDPGSVGKGKGDLGHSGGEVLEIVLPLSLPLRQWLPTLRAELERLQ